MTLRRTSSKKQTSKPSGKPFNPDESFPDYSAPITRVEDSLPTFPKFPTVPELLSGNPHPLLQLAEPPKRPPSWGLLQELLGGRLDVLTHDVVFHPERYDEPTRELLTEIASDPQRSQRLTADEQQALNRAVIDYAAFKPLPKAPAQTPKRAPPPIPKVLLEEESGRAPQVEEDGPGGTLSSYWWLT